MKRNTPLRPACLALLLIGCSALAQAEAPQQRWVHGSWVNVRADAAADSTILTHFTSNTPVSLRAQNGKSCEITWEKEQRGFLPCTLLGERPLTLAEVANPAAAGGNNPQYSPPRAFWLAPSMDALFYAGKHFQKTLLSPQQYKLEEGGDDLVNKAAPRLVRYPVPEFEAMKALLEKGVVASHERDPPLLTCQQMQQAKELQFPKGRVRDVSTNPNLEYPKLENFPHLYPLASDCRLSDLPKLALPKIRPSLFKHASELAPSRAGIERLSAHFGIVERGRVVGAPKWELDRNEGYRNTGAWDIGSYELALTQPLIEHVIGSNGRMGAYQWLPRERMTPFKADDSCGEGYDPYVHMKPRAKQVVAGAPNDALLWFHARTALPYQVAKIHRRKEPLPSREGEGDAVRLVAVYEIDLDGDGIADFAQWDESDNVDPDRKGLQVNGRHVFVNINGEWHPFDAEYYNDC